MNWQHLKTFLWLRWRLVSNRNRRAGSASVILQTIIFAIAILVGFLAFAGGLAAGYFGLPQASPETFMLIWDGVVVAFLFFWMTELLVELQRSELFSLDKFLHLPVTLGTAFLINYVGSISSVGALVFLPLMLGASIGLVLAKGAAMLLLFPLIAAFALMVTALTHQFRGWLASLMVNKRRRRTIISVATLAFILIVQIPNIITFTSRNWRGNPDSARETQISREVQELDRALAVGEITRREHRRRVSQLRRPDLEEAWKSIRGIAGTINQVVPLGWLPFGAAAAFEGRGMPGLLGTVGLALIGVVSLRRSYRTTMRLYTGQFTSGTPARTPVSEREASAPSTSRSRDRQDKYPARFLENRIPGLSEHASAVTLVSFRSILRAPEAKLMLLSPVIMMLVFGGMFFRNTSSPPELLRPLMTSGAFTFLFFMMIGMVGNQFSFDRSGFRTFVLSPAQRKDVLLGKNAAMAPFVMGFMTLAALLFQYRFPMRIDHFLALLFQMVPMYLAFCLIGNLLSIIAPMPTAAGSMKPVKPKAATMLIHLAFMVLFPVALSPTLIPLGIEFLLSWYESLAWVPVYLILAIVECATAIWLYPIILGSQGRFLQSRERRILEVVTAKTE